MKIITVLTHTVSILLWLAPARSAMARSEPPPVDATRLPPRGLHAYGWTQLHWLARTGNSDSIQAGIRQGLDLEARDIHQRTPLHLAVLAVNTEAVHVLLDAGADVNTRDQWGVTPLRRAQLLAETRGWPMDAVAALLREHGGQKPELPVRRELPLK